MNPKPNMTLDTDRSYAAAPLRQVSSTLVRQAQLGASYRVPYREVGSPNRAKLSQQPVPSGTAGREVYQNHRFKSEPRG
jgi:hypothetical protein